MKYQDFLNNPQIARGRKIVAFGGYKIINTLRLKDDINGLREQYGLQPLNHAQVHEYLERYFGLNMPVPIFGSPRKGLSAGIHRRLTHRQGLEILQLMLGDLARDFERKNGRIPQVFKGTLWLINVPKEPLKEHMKEMRAKWHKKRKKKRFGKWTMIPLE